MKKTILLLLLAVVTMGIFASCDNDENQESPISSNNNTPAKELSFYCGVWENPNNSFLFLSIEANGWITYCFNRYCIGKGYGRLDNGKLIVENTYTGYVDIFDFVESQESIILKGNANLKYLNMKFEVNLVFNKTQENCIRSLSGETWYNMGRLYADYGSCSYKGIFINDDIMKRQFYNHDSKKIIKENKLYYIPRTKGHNYYLYTHDVTDYTGYICVYDRILEKDIMEDN